jgi:hypothetical protein
MRLRYAVVGKRGLLRQFSHPVTTVLPQQNCIVNARHVNLQEQLQASIKAQRTPRLSGHKVTVRLR